MGSDDIKRRQFIKQSVAGVAIAASSGLAAGKTSNNITSNADVLVVGGGTAGTIAALQAARVGARTVLIERGGQLGGTTTVGGVSFPGLFHAWGRQIIAGIGWELVNRAVELDGGSLPDFTKIPKRHWEHQVHINQYLYALLAEEQCLKAGVEILYYEFPLSVEKAADGWLVMLKMARLREEQTQPGSMLFKCGDLYRPGREQLQAVYVHGADSSTSVTRTEANLAGRKAVLEKIRGKRLTHIQPEAAFRESYRILGETVISHEDYVSGRLFEDAVCYAFYPVDLHTRDGVKPKPLAKGVIPTVPLRALIPKGSRNIVAAGRCVSSDRLANSGLRVQASCMAMGQAAGAAAALAARRKTTPLDVPLEDIRRMLREHGAIVPGV